MLHSNRSVFYPLLLNFSPMREVKQKLDKIRQEIFFLFKIIFSVINSITVLFPKGIVQSF